MRELVFLKLGGSLITDKTRPYTVRLDTLEALMVEIGSTLSGRQDLRLLLGHGSGSFGHFAVKDHLLGLPNPFAGNGDRSAVTAYWRGYSEVRYRAAVLNQHVMDALHRAGIPAISLQPSAMVKAADGAVSTWDLTTVQAALDSGLVPVIYGDIVFDSTRGSTVLSTEALMIHLAPHLRPRRILLAGIEAAVWADYPERRHPIAQITPGSFEGIAETVGGSHGTDVTGGMKAKVQEMLALVGRMPGLTVQILSGDEVGNVGKALAGARLGTVLASD
jgi:isopentenyl phosphate kinase